MIPYWAMEALDDGARKGIDARTVDMPGKDTALGNIHYFPYEVDSGLAENVFPAVLALYKPLLGLIPNALSSATEGMANAYKNGATEEEIMGAGISNAVVEFGMGLLENAKWLGDVVDPRVKDAVLPVVGDVLNAAWDGLVLGEKSEYRAKVKEYEEKEYTTEEAKWKVLGDYIREVFTEFASKSVLDFAKLK